MAEKQPVVMVTGSSSGIGEALCRDFHARGCRVVATARRPDSMTGFAEGVRTEQLDVTDAGQIAKCVARVVEGEGRIDVLVNNAGYGLMGPVVELDEDALRAQFATNVFAPVALTRAVAAVMRENGGGVIVDMGSVSGLVTTPFSGAYCASKAALHALDDALRMELAPFGIRVMTVQPGSIRSGFGTAASATVGNGREKTSWYAGIYERILERANMSQVGAMPTDAFARRVVDAALRPDPPSHLLLGPKSRAATWLKRLLPVALQDRLLRRRFGLDELAREHAEAKKKGRR